MKKEKIILSIAIIALFCLFGFIFTEKWQREQDLEMVPLSERASWLNTDQSLAKIAAPSIENMIIEAEKDGMCLVVISGYRTRELQEKIYNEAKDKSLVAIPGESEHELGLAVDLGGCPLIDGVRNDAGERLELGNDFETLPEYQWLVNNAEKYGFYQSYDYESWHWKYKY